MSVREYNTIMYPDLLDKIKGHRERQKYNEMVMRKVGFSALISASIVGSKDMPKTEQEYWPIEGEEVVERKTKAENKQEAFKRLIEKTNGKV